MAQKKNKQANNKNKSDIDVINPEGFSIAQLDELDAKTIEQKAELEKQLDKVNKEIRGKMWIWWFLPIFGWIVYVMVMQNRLVREENQTKLITVKRAIAEKEIQLVLDKKQRDQLNNDKH